MVGRTDSHLVVVVDHAVAVDVLILDIAGHHLTELLLRMRADIVVVCKQALSHEAIYLANAISGVELIGISNVLDIVVKDSILRISHIAADCEGPITELIRVAEIAIDTFRLHGAHVGPWRRLQTEGSWHEIAEHIDAGTLLVEVVGRKRELIVEDRDVDTDVLLSGNLPGHVVGSEGGVVHTVLPVADSRGLDGTEVVDIVAAVVDGVEVGETDVHGVVADLTPGVAELELIEPSGSGLHEFLARESPTYGESGEETPAVIVSEILRTVVAEIDISEVAVVVVVEELAGKRKILLSHRILDIVADILSSGERIVGVLYVGAYVVEAEVAVVVEEEVDEEATRAIIVRALVHRLHVEDLVENDLTGSLIAAVGIPAVGLLIVLDLRKVVGVVADTASEFKAFSDEAEILLKRDIVLEVVVPLGKVAGLSGHDPRVGAELVAAHIDHGDVAIGIEHRSKDSVIAEEGVPEIHVALSGSVTGREVARSSDADDSGRSGGDVEVDTIVPTVVVGVGVVLILDSAVGLIHTLVGDVRHRRVVASAFATT